MKTFHEIMKSDRDKQFPRALEIAASVLPRAHRPYSASMLGEVLRDHGIALSARQSRTLGMRVLETLHRRGLVDRAAGLDWDDRPTTTYMWIER